MANSKTRILHEEVNSETLVDSNGSVTEQISTTKKTYSFPKEPNYIKLYFDHLNAFNGIQVSMSPILYDFLKYSTYADPEDENGGMILICNKALKERVAKTCEVSLSRVDHAITEFVKKEYMTRLGTGLYQFNPFLFGKGDWRDVYKIRATYDYTNGEVIADIVHSEEQKMNEATEIIEKETNEEIKKIGA